jgi:dTDP-4-amino-4,6-dideoxygalactose transaminase
MASPFSARMMQDFMIPIIDLKAQHQAIQAELDAAIARCLANTSFILGPDVAAFEADFAKYCESSAAIGVNSGTSALHLALLAVGVGPGDEVITTPYTFIATASAIDYCGAKPVFVDIDPRTFNIDPSKIEPAITPRTRAILPVHLYGQCADMQPILEIARRRGLRVIEDACQAHGATYAGRRAGSLGDAGCFSFYPAKNLGACGEGGAVTTSNPEIEKKVRMLRDWGQSKKYTHELRGYNYRLEGIQGAILGVKLKHLERWTERRRAIAARYDAALSGLVKTPLAVPGNRHVYHIYCLRMPQRDRSAETLKQRGIATAIHYPTPLHLQPAFRHLGQGPGSFPHAEQAAAEVVSLPIYPEMTDAQVEEVIEAVKAAVG